MDPWSGFLFSLGVWLMLLAVWPYVEPDPPPYEQGRDG